MEIAFTSDQKAKLVHLAERRKCSVESLVRMAVDALLHGIMLPKSKLAPFKAHGKPPAKPLPPKVLTLRELAMSGKPLPQRKARPEKVTKEAMKCRY